MSNLQPNCCLEFDFQKVDQHAGGKWLIHDSKRYISKGPLANGDQFVSASMYCNIDSLYVYSYRRHLIKIIVFDDLYISPHANLNSFWYDSIGSCTPIQRLL